MAFRKRLGSPLSLLRTTAASLYCVPYELRRCPSQCVCARPRCTGVFERFDTRTISLRPKTVWKRSDIYYRNPTQKTRFLRAQGVAGLVSGSVTRTCDNDFSYVYTAVEKGTHRYTRRTCAEVVPWCYGAAVTCEVYERRTKGAQDICVLACTPTARFRPRVSRTYNETCSPSKVL